MQPLALDAAQQVAREIQILPVSGGSVQLNQRHLKFGVSGERRALGRPEVRDHVVHEPDAAIQQFPVAGGAVVCNRGLQQVAQAIQLVRAIHLGEPLVLALVDVIRIQVAAGLLRGQDFVRQTVERRPQIRPVFGLEHIGHRLHPLVDVRIGV